MPMSLLDKTYYLAVDLNRDITPLPDHYRDEACAELAKLFPDSDRAQIENAYRRARDLIDLAVDLADQRRGPKNDDTGLTLEYVDTTMKEESPGFSSGVYQEALANGYYITK